MISTVSFFGETVSGSESISNRLCPISLSGLEYWFLPFRFIASNSWRYPLIGAGIGGVILAVAMLLSRKGVGMGDVKLFITIGAYVGSMEIIATLFYTFVVSAVVGIVLLLMKKVKLRDSVPMAPFAFAGVAIEYAFMLIGG